MENLMAELLPVMMGKTKGLKAVFMKKRYRFFGSAAAILLLWNLCLGPFPPGGSAPYHWERDLEAIHGASHSGRVVFVLDEGGQRVPEDLSCSCLLYTSRRFRTFWNWAVTAPISLTTESRDWTTP